MLSQAVRLWATSACLSIVLTGCLGHRFERAFMNGPVETRVERLREYSLEDQYKIFIYGMHYWHPPVMVLASPIAERGASAVPFLLSRLEVDTKSSDVGDILVIVERMTVLKTYDARSDERLMSLLALRVGQIEDEEWRRICQKNLQAIKNP